MGPVSGIHSGNADSVRNQLPWTDGKTLHPQQPAGCTYIGIIGMLAAVPASPVSAPIIYWTGKIDLMASITPFWPLPVCC